MWTTFTWMPGWKNFLCGALENLYFGLLFCEKWSPFGLLFSQKVSLFGLFFIIFGLLFLPATLVLFHAKPNSGGNLEIIFDSMDGAVVKKKFNCFQFAVLKTSRNAMSSVFKCFYFANPTHCIAKYFIWTAQAEQESDW